MPANGLRSMRASCELLGGVATLLLMTAQSVHAQQVDPAVVIRQVYGGGGNSGAPYTNDFVELFNRSQGAVSLAGWSVQYTSATGSGSFGANSGLITLLPSVVLQPGQSFLVQESGGANGVALPLADVVGSINMAATAGKVALAASTVGLACNGSSTPCSAAALSQIVDLVGFGNANFFEGAGAASTLSNSIAATRANAGCSDTNNNAADFIAAAPAPRSTASALAACGTTGGAVGACGDPATAISAIQGSGPASPLVGTTVNVEGVVVGDFQDNNLNGFFLQTADSEVDGDANTSEGLFVFEGSSTVAVASGDRVRVRGQVSEYQSLTELNAVTDVLGCGAGSSMASALSLSLPVAAVSDFERYEGMLVSIAQQLTVTGNFELGRFGSLDLAVNGRLFSPTNLVAPGAAANALQSLNDRSRIILDDASDLQNPNPIPYKDGNNTRRVGDSLSMLSGVLDGRFTAYRIQPTGPISFSAGNPRSPTPSAVGGRLRVGFANVLNFFTTLDEGGTTCGPSGGLGCRGANTAAEFDQQRTKLLNALKQLDYDIVGLSELENNKSASLQSLVDGLNATSPGSYTYLDTGTIGTDAIKVGLLYKSAKVSLAGGFALLTSAVNPLFIDTKNRPALAQTFVETATGARFTMVVNHLKSKGSDCLDVSDPDPADGQGNCNQTRTKAAQALLTWLAGDPTHSGDPDFLLIGDLNAYAKEDPISALKAGGYQALLETKVGAAAYSYQFQGQSGYLDHALTTAAMSSQVTGITEWHSNADEPVVLDYNTEFKTDNPFNLSDPFRASDHDPILIGLNLTGGSASSAVPALQPWQRALTALLLMALGTLPLVLRRGRRALEN